MTGVRRLELDVLKPNEPSVVSISEKLSALKGVDAVDILVREVDRKVETVRIIIEGDNLDLDNIKNVLEKAGAAIHSVDRVSSGRNVLELKR